MITYYYYTNCHTCTASRSGSKAPPTHMSCPAGSYRSAKFTEDRYKIFELDLVLLGITKLLPKIINYARELDEEVVLI